MVALLRCVVPHIASALPLLPSSAVLEAAWGPTQAGVSSPPQALPLVPLAHLAAIPFERQSVAPRLSPHLVPGKGTVGSWVSSEVGVSAGGGGAALATLIEGEGEEEGGLGSGEAGSSRRLSAPASPTVSYSQAEGGTGALATLQPGSHQRSLLVRGNVDRGVSAECRVGCKVGESEQFNFFSPDCLVLSCGV